MSETTYLHAIEARFHDYLEQTIAPDALADINDSADLWLILRDFITQEAYVHAREAVGVSMDSVIRIGIDYGFLYEDGDSND